MRVKNSKKKREIVIKRNDFIEANMTCSNFGVLHNRIILNLASRIKGREMTDFTIQRFSLAELRSVMMSNLTIADLRKLFKELRAITFEVKEHTTGNWKIFGLIDRAEYVEESKEIELKLGSDMAPYFLAINEHVDTGLGFTRLGYEEMMNMRSFYSQRIYELLIQYRKIGHRHFNLNDFKKHVGLLTPTYKRWSKVADVLNMAQVECSDAGLVFEWKTIKGKGKAIAGVVFDFEYYEGKNADARLLKENLSVVAANKIELYNTPQKIDAALSELEKQRANIKNPAAWLTKMLIPKRMKDCKQCKEEVQKWYQAQIAPELPFVEELTKEEIREILLD